MAALKDLQKAFTEQLRDTLNAEKQLTKALRQMARKASSEDLKAAFEEHLEQTEVQIERLEQVFEFLDQKPRGKHCAGMEGLIEEGKEVMEEEGEPEAKDAMMISAAQKVEHYEIAAYGTLCAWADKLGLTEIKELLTQTLEEEKETDQKLTALAEEINLAATPA